MPNLNCGKSIPSAIKKTTQSKQSPTGRKFAQFGHFRKHAEDKNEQQRRDFVLCKKDSKN
jgi:hypothetical protein